MLVFQCLLRTTLLATYQGFFDGFELWIHLNLCLALSPNSLISINLKFIGGVVGDDTESLEWGSAVRSSCDDENLSLRPLNIFLNCPNVYFLNPYI